MRGQPHSLPTAPPRRGLRDVRDVDSYVGQALDRIGVRPGSAARAMLLEHGVRSAYRLERALPPEASLRAVLDDVLPQRLLAGLRRAPASDVAERAVA